MRRNKLLFGMIWVVLTILYYLAYGIVNQVIDVRENGFDLVNTTISLLPFVISVGITYVLIRLIARCRTHKVRWMIILSILLAVPTSLSVIKLLDQQLKKVDPIQHQTLAENFQKQINAIQGSGITTTRNVKELTHFAWDKLYLFSPYTSHTQINERLGYTWTHNSLRLSYDNSYLLVFILNGKVVQYLDLSTPIQGDRNTSYTPERASIQFFNTSTDNNQTYHKQIQLIERSN